MTRPPNILIITLHDAGRHFHCYGVDSVRTPAVDALGAQGVRCTQVFACAPVCSPSRGGMLTGRWPQSNGLMGLTHSPWDWSFHPGERHLSHLLRDAGYHTVLCGLQHESAATEQLGFCETYAEAAPAGGRQTGQQVAAAAAAFLRDQAAGVAPFYLQIGLFESHRPFGFGGAQPDETNGVWVPPYLADAPRARAELAALQGAIGQADGAVGAILAALRSGGLEENTIVVFAVDHGIEFPRAKWTLYEAGIGVALIVRWPAGGVAGGRTCEHLLSNIDVLPTLLELADLPVPGNVEGSSAAAVWRDPLAAAPRDATYSMFTGREARCIRTERLKLLRTFTPGRLLETPVDMDTPVQRRKCPVVQLFDVLEDPLETQDLAENSAYSSVLEALDERLWTWLETVDDPILRGPVPTPYYHEAMGAYRKRRAAGA